MSTLCAKPDVDNQQLSTYEYYVRIQYNQVIMYIKDEPHISNRSQKYTSSTFGDYHENSENSCFCEF